MISNFFPLKKKKRQSRNIISSTANAGESINLHYDPPRQQGNYRHVQLAGIFKQCVLSPSPPHLATSTRSSFFFSNPVVDLSSYNVAKHKKKLT